MSSVSFGQATGNPEGRQGGGITNFRTFGFRFTAKDLGLRELDACERFLDSEREASDHAILNVWQGSEGT